MSGEDFVVASDRRYRVSTLKQFRDFRHFCDGPHAAWKEHHSNDGITVWSRPPVTRPGQKPSGLNVVKMKIDMPDVPPHVLYDALHDADYRKSWDENMIEGYNICPLNPHNDIGYYAVKFPWPLSNRDFCNMRCWMEFTNGEFVIFNYSVPHAKCPERPDFVRGKSIMTGYYIKVHPNGTGTRLMYITHSDPAGSIPHTVINWAMTSQAPNTMAKLRGNAERYPAWMKEHNAIAVPSWRTSKMDWDAVDENYPPPFVRPPLQKSVEELSEKLEQLKMKIIGADGGAASPEALAAVDRKFLDNGIVPTEEEYMERLSAILVASKERSN